MDEKQLLNDAREKFIADGYRCCEHCGQQASNSVVAFEHGWLARRRIDEAKAEKYHKALQQIMVHCQHPFKGHNWACYVEEIVNKALCGK